MKLKHINYAELNSRQRETFNFQKVAGLLADYGFNCMKLTDDWQGADFLAYHKDGTNTLKVQLKSRLCISQRYVGKAIYMAFPLNGGWFLIEHDHLVGLIKKHTTWLTSESWCARGNYTSSSTNTRLAAALKEFKLRMPNNAL